MKQPGRPAFLASATAALATLGAVPSIAQAAQGDDNASLFNRYVAAFNAQNVDAFAGFIADNYVQHETPATGIAGLQASLRRYYQVFPDIRMEVQDRVFAGDRIVARNLMTATHTQPVQLGPGSPLFPATGKKVAWAAFDIWRVENGKIAEFWSLNDYFALAQQMRAA
jgi:predicted ester cyclase